MKTMKVVIIIMFFIAIALPAYSLDVTLGMNVFYFRWLPNFEDYYRGVGNGVTESSPSTMSAAYNDRFESDTVFMVGPVVNLRISEHWSLGFVFLASQAYNIESSFDVYDSTMPETFTSRWDVTYHRYDSDLTLNYRVTPWLGFFGGIKYLKWNSTGDYDVTTSAGMNVYHVDMENDGQASGPALGFGITYPFAGGFYSTASFSGVYMKARENYDTMITKPPDPTISDRSRETYDYRGFNIMAGIGYFISSLRSTLIIGVRYQYLRMEDEPRDLFYGITATVLYHF